MSEMDVDVDVDVDSVDVTDVGPSSVDDAVDVTDVGPSSVGPSSVRKRKKKKKKKMKDEDLAALKLESKENRRTMRRMKRMKIDCAKGTSRSFENVRKAEASDPGVSGKKWIDDIKMNEFCNKLRMCDEFEKSNVAIAGTFLFQALQAEQYLERGIGHLRTARNLKRKSYKNKNVQEHYKTGVDTIIIPINVVNRHWIAGICNFKNMSIEIYDPKKNADGSLWKPKPKKNDDGSLREPMSEETFFNILTRVFETLGMDPPVDKHILAGNKLPQQQDGHNCGIFVCNFLRVIIPGGVG